MSVSSIPAASVLPAPSTPALKATAPAPKTPPPAPVAVASDADGDNDGSKGGTVNTHA
jgi:hypothetical protein